MDTKNNSAQDNNALTKSDNESSFPINFQPMPKRFMVWDKEAHDFVKRVNGYILNWREIANLVEPTVWDCAAELDEVAKRFTIIQSTNLFDEDGEEIFEGSAVRDFDEAIGVVYYDMEEGGYWAKCSNGDSFEIADSSCDLKVLGHILSNPKLLEEKTC